MASELRDGLKVVLVLIAVLSTGSAGPADHDQDWRFCGLWLHDRGSLQLNLNISTGCSNISVQANKKTLSIHGQMTARCQHSAGFPLDRYGLGSEEESYFCLYWEPPLDRLILQIRPGQNLTLCESAHPEGTCCTDLSIKDMGPEMVHGIKSAMVITDVLNHNTCSSYSFRGQSVPCGTLRGNSSHQSSHLSSLELRAEHGFPVSFNIDLEDSRPRDLESPISRGQDEEPTVTVHLPPAFKLAMKTTTRVAVTFYTNATFFQFQDSHKETKILSEVVDITVENEIIADLSEPIRINFYHDAIQKGHSRKCVAWDSMKNPLQVKWLTDGCATRQRDDEHTECSCNHLTYFTVLVELQHRPVRYLLALTVITYLGCAASFISCVALIVFLCTKSRHSKEQSVPIHLGLAASLTVLHLLFFLTGVLANLEVKGLCAWVGAGIHYSLLSSFTWMGIEIFHTFWLVYVVFTPSPKPYVWNLVGFGLPLIPVVVLAAVGDIYGLVEVIPAEDPSDPYRMCWMKDSTKARLAHYLTNVTSVILLVLSGIVMLILVYRKIRIRDEWRQTPVAFFSIWGLSVLFGTSWSLSFFGFLSDLVPLLSCFLISFQGFFIALRFCMLEWLRKRAVSSLGSHSTGSTRQHMLQEKS